MHWYLLLPFAGAIVFPLGSILLKEGMARGGGVLRSFFVSNVVLALCFLALLPFVEESPNWSHVAWPIATGAVFFIGQLFVTLAIKVGDVSVQSPLMGLKVIFVAIISFFIGTDEISLTLWAAAILSTLAVFLVGGGTLKKTLQHGKTILLCTIACVFFGFTDAFMGYRNESFGTTPFLIVMAMALGFFSFAVMPFFGDPLTTIPRKAWSFLIWGGLAFGAQAVLIAIALGQFGKATEINIVYSTRGLIGVLMVWTIGHWFGNQEGKTVGREIMQKRLVGSLLMCVAIVLTLI
ncbi:MAG: DMT family transporter [Verrucomicrobiota bacterium]